MVPNTWPGVALLEPGDVLSVRSCRLYRAVCCPPGIRGMTGRAGYALHALELPQKQTHWLQANQSEALVQTRLVYGCLVSSILQLIFAADVTQHDVCRYGASTRFPRTLAPASGQQQLDVSRHLLASVLRLSTSKLQQPVQACGFWPCESTATVQPFLVALINQDGAESWTAGTCLQRTSSGGRRISPDQAQ